MKLCSSNVRSNSPEVYKTHNITLQKQEGRQIKDLFHALEQIVTMTDKTLQVFKSTIAQTQQLEMRKCTTKVIWSKNRKLNNYIPAAHNMACKSFVIRMIYSEYKVIVLFTHILWDGDCVHRNF